MTTHDPTQNSGCLLLVGWLLAALAVFGVVGLTVVVVDRAVGVLRRALAGPASAHAVTVWRLLAVGSVAVMVYAVISGFNRDGRQFTATPATVTTASPAVNAAATATAARIATARAGDPSVPPAAAAGERLTATGAAATATQPPNPPRPSVTRPPSVMQVATRTPLPTATPSPSATRSPTPSATRPPSVMRQPTSTGGPRPRPTDPPPTREVVAAAPVRAFDWAPASSRQSSLKCANVSRPQNAANSPIAIVAVDKVAETVTLANTSGVAIDVSDWYICSFTGRQLHAVLIGVLPAGAVVTVGPPMTNIWNNNEPDAAYLVLPDFTAVAYFPS